MSFERIAADFRARAMDFVGLKACVKFDFGDDGSLCVDAKETPPAICEDSTDVDCTIRLSLENLEKLIAGSLSPTLAYAMGKLKIEGSMGVAMKVASMLDS